MDRHVTCKLAKENAKLKLPKIAPGSNWFKVLLAQVQSWALLSDDDVEYKITFHRSRRKILDEKRRHLRSGYWYILHPYSKLRWTEDHFVFFRLLWEKIISIFILYAFLADPLTLAFMSVYTVNHDPGLYYLFQFIFDLVFILDMYVIISTAYYEYETQTLILKPKRIFFHYIHNGKFFADFLCSIPFRNFMLVVYPRLPLSDNSLRVLSVFGLFKIFQIFRLKRLVNVIYLLFENYHYVSHFIVFCILTFFQIHWSTCALIYSEFAKTYHETLVPTTLNDTSYSWFHTYQINLGTAMELFLRIGEFDLDSKEHNDDILFIHSVIMVVGYMYYLFITVIGLQILRVQQTAESLFKDKVNQLKNFMACKHIDGDLNVRMNSYYKYYFGRKYCNKQFIMHSLSAHVQNEIKQYIMRNLLSRNVLFLKSNRLQIEKIINCLKPQIFISTDVIYIVGMPADMMYFVVHGCVILMGSNGQEVEHLVDGECFGEFEMLPSNQSQTRIMTAIADEPTEVYCLSLAHVQKHILSKRILLEHLEQKAERTRKLLQNSSTPNVDIMSTSETTYIYNLFKST